MNGRLGRRGQKGGEGGSMEKKERERRRNRGKEEERKEEKWKSVPFWGGTPSLFGGSSLEGEVEAGSGPRFPPPHRRQQTAFSEITSVSLAVRAASGSGPALARHPQVSGLSKSPGGRAEPSRPESGLSPRRRATILGLMVHHYLQTVL